MKTGIFISAYIGCHLGFAFLQVYKQSSLVKLSYQKQKNEKLLTDLAHQKSTLLHELELLKNKSVIKLYAINKLTMEKIRLEHIKRVVV